MSRCALSLRHQHSARARLPPTRRSLKLLTKRWFIRAATQATEPRGEPLARSGPGDASSSSRPDGGVRGRDDGCAYRSPSSPLLGQQPLRRGDGRGAASSGVRGSDESRRSVVVVAGDKGTLRPPLSLRGRPGGVVPALARASALAPRSGKGCSPSSSVAQLS